MSFISWLLDHLPANVVATGMAAFLFAFVSNRWRQAGVTVAVGALTALGTTYFLALFGILTVTLDDFVAALKVLIDPNIMAAASVGGGAYVGLLLIQLRAERNGRREGYDLGYLKGHEAGFREGYEKAKREARHAA